MAEPPAAPSRSTLQTTAPLNIVMATPEAVPFAKTGGLGDVASALPLELAKLGHDIRLVIPRYGFIKGAAYEFKEYERLTVPTFAGPVPAVVEQGVLAGGPGRSVRVPVLAIRSDPYFDRPGLYQIGGADYPDNLERFAFFSRAVLELLIVLREREGWGTEVLHVHDWQTALCPIYLRTVYADRSALRTVSSLLTLHNLGFQGIFPGADYPKTLLPPELFTPKILEFYGSLNLLKGGLLFADYLNTVSPTYGREIQTAEFGFGLEGVVRERRERLSGVVNGIDTEVWNPAKDPHLPARYSSLDLSGKAECKTALQREVGLPVRNVPVLVMVSRLTAQKGLDLVAEIIPELMELDLQLIVLGTGDPSYEALFTSLQAKYPQKLGLRIGFDEGLAHRIEAGGDLFLMPSRYEPCGLSQLISLRYGTVPVVRRTGGLADTVVPYSPRAIREGRATGFVFGEATPDSLLLAVLLALRIYQDTSEWQALVRTEMGIDVSWERSARAYVDLYRQVNQLPRHMLPFARDTVTRPAQHPL